jgi:uncharacterized protein (TIGR00297 family)
MLEWTIGFACSLTIAALAYAKRSLTGTGAAAAVIIGTIMFALGSLVWFGTLIAFFVSSTALTKWKQKVKAKHESVYEKGARRDAGQVAANGGLAVLLCAADYLWPHPYWFAVFLGAMATVNADTWATEIGGLSKRLPRSILTWKQVPKGTSGGVSLLGSGAVVFGGLFIGAAAWLLQEFAAGTRVGAGEVAAAERIAALPMFTLSLVGGFIGAMTDSIIGAKWQVMYRCAVCAREVEHEWHCSESALLIRGLPWLHNDAVNFLSSAVGGLASLAILQLI